MSGQNALSQEEQFNIHMGTCLFSQMSQQQSQLLHTF